MDEYWKAALLATLDLVPYVDLIFTPKAFFPFSRKFYPFEFSCIRQNLPVAFCVQKDLLHRLDHSLLESVDSPGQIIYSNDVFVVGCLKPQQHIKWYYSEEYRYNEYMELRAVILAGINGRNQTAYWRTDKGLDDFKVLIVGASNMGNIGDDLIAMAIGGHLREIRSDISIYFSDFTVSRPDLADFNLIIVGGGGIIYSCQFGMNDMDNLANYLKIPIWAKELSVPCLIMGVGVQGRPGHLSKDPFVLEFLKKSLMEASNISVRDQLSKDGLSGITENKITIIPDLVFSFASKYPYYNSKYDRVCSRSIVFIGELFSERLSFFNHLLKGTSEDFFRIFGGADIRYCIMSDDDLPHGDKFIDLMNLKGIACKVHDLRNSSIVDALNFFRGMSGVVTTRFHGLVLSIIAGCPVLSIDLSFGKHALLIKDYFPSIKNNLISEKNQTDEMLQKLKILAESASTLLPDIEEIEAVSLATNEYKNILRGFLKTSNKSDSNGKDDIGKDDVGKDDIGKDDVGKDDVGKDDVGKVAETACGSNLNNPLMANETENSHASEQADIVRDP